MHTPGQQRCRDAGETLLEVLVAVTIMAIAVPAVIGSVLVGVMMADIHRKQATAGGAARTYAEKIEAYAASAGSLPTTPAGYQAAVAYTLPGFTPTVTWVQCWNTTTSQFGACPSDSRVQQVAVQVSSSDGRATEKLTVVVRQP